jgi:hypothetical protein
MGDLLTNPRPFGHMTVWMRARAWQPWRTTWQLWSQSLTCMASVMVCEIGWCCLAARCMMQRITPSAAAFRSWTTHWFGHNLLKLQIVSLLFTYLQEATGEMRGHTKIYQLKTNDLDPMMIMALNGPFDRIWQLLLCSVSQTQRISFSVCDTQHRSITFTIRLHIRV